MSGAIAIGVIGAAVTAGAAIGSARRQKRLAKEQNNITKKALSDQQKRQEYLDTFAKPMLESGNENLGITQDYLRRLASGDRSLTQQTLAPEINALTQQSQGAVAAQRGLYPRGGQSASQAAQLPYQLQGNVNNLMFGARPQAMQQLGQLGSNQASLGLSGMGMGAGLTNSMLQYGLDAQRLQMQQGMALGQGVGGALQWLQQMYGHGGSNNNALSAYMAQDYNPTTHAGEGFSLMNQPQPQNPTNSTAPGFSNPYNQWNPYGGNGGV